LRMSVRNRLSASVLVEPSRCRWPSKMTKQAPRAFWYQIRGRRARKKTASSEWKNPRASRRVWRVRRGVRPYPRDPNFRPNSVSIRYPAANPERTNRRKSFADKVHPEGFEPPTLDSEVRRPISATRYPATAYETAIMPG
jgi:hypothetical protein